MSTPTRCVILPSMYRDSVALLQLSHTLNALSGVQQAAVMMGTLQNQDLLREAGLLTPEGEEAEANDLLICIQAETLSAAENAVHTARQLCMQPHVTAETAPRTLETALHRMPEANLACISVPGQYAPHEARRALQYGLHVFLFSDHVDIEAEAELKSLASQHGLLVMGPDCGTAILGGAPLGFANQLPRGPVGLVAASGTGLQQVSGLLAQHGVGVSQALGVGGRDLHQRLRGHSMRAALRALAADADTRVIVLISKPPAPGVASLLAQDAAHSGKPCVLAFVGDESPWSETTGVYKAITLEHAALMAAALARGEPVPTSPQHVPHFMMPSLQAARTSLQPTQRAIRALYCGGTLAYEALWLLRSGTQPVTSNLDGSYDFSHATGHVVLDLGAEAFTSGRPHPMIDPTVRQQQLLHLAEQPEVAVVLCDVMLGWGAHEAPAEALATAWDELRDGARTRGRTLIGIATVCGTPDDPQGYANQCRVLREHGFLLAESNAQAVRLAAAVVGTEVGARSPSASQDKAPALPADAGDDDMAPEIPVHLASLFTAGPRVINLGLELFATQLAACGVPVTHVDWRPPAGGDARLADLLARLR